MESFFLSEVSTTGVFVGVQLEKIEAREQNYQNDRKFILSAGKTSLIERLKTLDDTVAQNIYIFDTMGWLAGKKCQILGMLSLNYWCSISRSPYLTWKFQMLHLQRKCCLMSDLDRNYWKKMNLSPIFANRLCYTLKISSVIQTNANCLGFTKFIR